MANSGSAAINTGELPQFGVLKPHEQRAVVLRSENCTASEITNTINAEYGMALKTRTIEEWFYADGRLIQAYLEYNSKLAEQAVEIAKAKIQKASEDAADTLVELMSNKYEGGVRVRAALGVLAKYVPDRQVMLDGGKEQSLPAQLGEAMDKAMDDDKPADEPKPEEQQPDGNDAPQSPAAS